MEQNSWQKRRARLEDEILFKKENRDLSWILNHYCIVFKVANKMPARAGDVHI